ncbi:MAG: VOC family protein [Pseudomonadales bacterium]|nr:VOC family protein [Pseudomonadales bacterium]
MQLGAFSVSLSVKNLSVSRTFYEKLGFQQISGNPDDNWSIMRNGDHVIGLFQGMFEHNVLTFNPGWNQQGAELAQFTDIRDIQRELKKRGIVLAGETDESTTGPGSCMIMDPDGNPILIDQHR